MQDIVLGVTEQFVCYLSKWVKKITTINKLSHNVSHKNVLEYEKTLKNVLTTDV